MLEVVERSEENSGEMKMKSLPILYSSVPHAILKPKVLSFGIACLPQRPRYGIMLFYTFWKIKSSKTRSKFVSRRLAPHLAHCTV